MKAYQCFRSINCGAATIETEKGGMFKPGKFVPAGQTVLLDPEDGRTKKWLRVKAIALKSGASFGKARTK